MIVQHNLTAMNSNRMLGLTTSAQAKSSEKLSSGYKINRAADDAAGLTISEKMRRQIRGLTQASLNAQDGISCVQTAEGALTEVHDMLQRMDELATKAANGTMSEDDRQAIQDEIDQLIKEIDRVSETTNFNEMDLLKGAAGTDRTYSYITTDASYGFAAGTSKLYDADGKEYSISDLQALYEDIDAAKAAADNYFTAREGVATDLSSKSGNALAAGELFNGIISIDADTGELSYAGAARLYDETTGDELSVSDLEQLVTDGYFRKTGSAGSFGLSYGDSMAGKSLCLSRQGKTAATSAVFEEVSAGTAKLYTKDADGNAVEIAADKLADYFDEDGKLKAGAEIYKDDQATDPFTDADLEDYINVEEKAAALEFKLHVGAESAEENKISVTIEAMSAEGIGIHILASDYEDEDGNKGKGVTDQDSATSAIDTIKAAISKVSKQRSALGAVQNRLEHTINNLDNIVENTTAAEAQIRDTDIATEMVKYANNNILQQAGTSMLAQANQTNQLALSLLG